MKHGILIVAIVLIGLGVTGVIGLNIWQSVSFDPNKLQSTTTGAFGMMDGMMGDGNVDRMISGGMMGGHAFGYTPKVNATLVPSNQPID